MCTEGEGNEAEKHCKTIPVIDIGHCLRNIHLSHPLLSKLFGSNSKPIDEKKTIIFLIDYKILKVRYLCVGREGFLTFDIKAVPNRMVN